MAKGGMMSKKTKYAAKGGAVKRRRGGTVRRKSGGRAR